VPQIWKDFLKVHTSPHFLKETLTLVSQGLEKAVPSFLKKFSDFDKLDIGTRYNTTFIKNIPGIKSKKQKGKKGVDVMVDCQICLNTPVTTYISTSVRTTHLDDFLELYGGLFYMRHPDDTSTGGAFEIYRLTGQLESDGRPKVEVHTTVEYGSNVIVMFLGSKDSIHAVTPRSKTPYPRRFVNIVGHIPDPIFPMNDHYEEMKVTLFNNFTINDISEVPDEKKK